MARLAAPVLALTLLAPRLASACLPWDAVVDSVSPAGSTHPANAAIILRGHQLVPDALTATIDGAPAAFVVDEQLSNLESGGEAYFTLALRLDPAPEPGQQVIVAGDPCYELDTCAALDLQFTAGPADTTPPLPLTIEPFDVERYLSAQSCDCCWGLSLIHATFGVPDDILDGELAVFYAVTAENPALDLDSDQRDHIDTLSKAGKTSIYIAAIGDWFPIDGWCLTVRTLDAAGNASAPVTSCDACLWTEHEGWEQLFLDWFPVPGGPCDLMEGSSSTGDPTTGDATTGDPTTGPATSDPAEDPLVPHGCSCEHAPAGPWWLFVPLLTVRPRRRNHAPGDTSFRSCTF